MPDGWRPRTMKSRRKIVITLAMVLAIGPKVLDSLHAQDADTKPAEDQSGIRIVLPKGKKLVLKDGTFQVAREYSVQDDRVRYWSVERSDWEEIPSSLVDWDATHKAESEQAAHDAELKAKIKASDLAERVKDIDVDRSLEIRPGIFLPDAVGFYALENGKLISEMKQSEADAHLSKKRETAKILTGIPLIPGKQTLELPGARATMRFTSGDPEFFMRPADDREPQFKLVRTEVKNGHRIIEKVSLYMGGGEGHSTNDVSFQTWTPARGVFRYTVEKRLEPGEYAFIETTKEGVSGYVWDFGIDPPKIGVEK